MDSLFGSETFEPCATSVNQRALQAIDGDADRERSVIITYTEGSFDDNIRKVAAVANKAPPDARRLRDPALVDAVEGEVGAQFFELEALADFSWGIASSESLRGNVRRLHNGTVDGARLILADPGFGMLDVDVLCMHPRFHPETEAQRV